MNINKINAKKSFFLTYLPFFIFFIIIFSWHFTLPRFGDDLWFSKIYHEYNIFNFLSIRYETWSSRWLIEFFLVPFAALPKILWNFFDSIIFLLMAVLIPKIVLSTEKIGEKKLFVYNSISCIGVSVFIFTIAGPLSSAGYIATTINYIWPLFFGLLHFYLLKKYVFNENNSGTIPKIAIYALMIFALIFAINQEIMLFVVSGVYFFLIVYCLYNKVKIPNSVLAMCFIIFLGFLNVVLCPGNHLRYSIEMPHWFPDYYKLTLVNKVDLGVSVLLNRIILSHTLINLLFFGILGAFVYSITKKKSSLLISMIPIIIIITLKLMTLMGYTPLVHFISKGVTKYGLLHSTLSHILVNSVIYMAIIFSVMYNLIQMYRYGKKRIGYIIFCLLILGFASQMTKGFSPTCWASADRWDIYYYFFITLVTYILTVNLLNNRYDGCKKCFRDFKIWKFISNDKN